MGDLAHAGPTNEQVRTLEAAMFALPPELHISLETLHLIHAGISARAVFIPAKTVLTGNETALDNLCIVLGDIEVSTNEGMRRFQGFAMLPAYAGAKRVGRTYADTWWITVHRTEQTTVRAVEDEMAREPALLQSRRELLS